MDIIKSIAVLFRRFMKGHYLILLLLLVNSPRAEISVNDSWFPDFVRVQVVSSGLNTNGVKMQIWELRSEKSTSDLLKFYQRLWSRKPGYLGYDASIWQVSGFMEGRSFVSVQLLRNQVDSFGYLTISQYPDDRPDLDNSPNLPLPSSSEVLSSISAGDGPHKSRTVVFRNALGFDSNVNFFRRHFIADGWVEDRPQNKVAGNLTMLFRKGADNATISVNDLDGEVAGVGVLVEH